MGLRCYFNVAAANILQRTTEYTGFYFDLQQKFCESQLANPAFNAKFEGGIYHF